MLELDLAALGSSALLELLRQFEQQKRRLPAIDHALVAEVGHRKVAFELCQPNDAAVLRQLLRISGREAHARVRAAADLGPRCTLVGERLEPLFATVAAAQADGRISAAHARVITDAVDELPGAVAVKHEADVIAILLEHAHTLDPDRLHGFAKRLVEALDPDGTLAEYADLERRRELSLTRNRDGSYQLSGRLTPLAGAIWTPILDSLSAPVPAVDGARDPRQPAQRRADGFEEAGQLLLRSEQLPHAGGVAVTLLITTTEEQLRTGEGLATTGSGDLIPLDRVIDLIGDTQTMTICLDSHGGVLDHGQAKRIVPAEMRLAIFARDKGCTFPGCDRTPAWTQAHHFIEFVAGGPTSLDNCGLVCGFHHRQFARNGWISVMINAAPHWIPPPGSILTKSRFATPCMTRR